MRAAPSTVLKKRDSAPPPRGLLSPGVPQRHVRLLPAPALAEHVAHWWVVSWSLAAPTRVRTLPHPSVHVTFEDGRARVHGMRPGPFERRLGASGTVVGLKFRPAAAVAWVGSVRALRGRTVSLRRFLPATVVGALLEAAATREPFEGCVAELERLLTPHLPPLEPATVRLRDAVERCAEDPTVTRVAQLAALAGLDVRGLQRACAKALGVGPKWVLARYRLHEALARLQAGEQSLAALAADLGYADQAHLTRDFRQVLGVTPGAFERTRRG